VANGDASFSEQILDISVTQVEAIVEPDGVTDDVRRESVPFICIHWPILSISAI
jgi:hypothetical protein